MAAEPEKRPARTVKERQVKTEWGGAEAVEPVFADQLHLTRLNDQYYLTFGQVRVPVAESSSVNEIQVHPVARLIVPRDALERMVALLSRSIE